MKTLDDIFNNLELYNELKFKIMTKEGDAYKLDKALLLEIVDMMGLKQKTITSLCKYCNMRYPFTISRKTDWILSGGPMSVGVNAIRITKSLYYNCEKSIFSSKADTFSEEELYNPLISVYEYKFECTKDNEHRYSMYLSIKRENEYFSITKIGQYPSMVDIWGFGFEQYKKQLSKIDGYSDFRKAELCYRDGFTAGAFTYLRRLFEKMLSSYCVGIELKDNHIETRISAAKSSFDERVYPMLQNLYKVLSRGIHELNDEEASDYYQYLRAVIAMQLEYTKEKNDKDEQSKQLSKTINDIASRI